MALSHLRQIVEKIASDKEVEIIGSMDTAMRSADRKLDGGDIDVSEAIKMLRSAFGIKFSSDDYRKIEKEVGINLRR